MKKPRFVRRCTSPMWVADIVILRLKRWISTGGFKVRLFVSIFSFTTKNLLLPESIKNVCLDSNVFILGSEQYAVYDK